MTSLNQKLSELESLEKAATPGPWSIYGATGEGTWIAQHEVLPSGYFKLIDYAYAYDRKRHKEAELIIAARNELPYLIATIRKMKEALEFYADKSNWQMRVEKGQISGFPYELYFMENATERARQVLKSLDEEMK